MKIKIPVCPTCAAICMGTPTAIEIQGINPKMLWVCGQCLPAYQVEPVWVEAEAS